jgi:citrate lyase beta subunit
LGPAENTEASPIGAVEPRPAHHRRAAGAVVRERLPSQKRTLVNIRSLIFTPANRPERMQRALACGADSICIDLEDSVAPQDKIAARSNALEMLSIATNSHIHVGVRINPLDTQWGAKDLASVKASAAFIVLPKVLDLHEIDNIRCLLPPDHTVWPIVESAAGLMRSWELAAAKGVGGIVFGAFDYVADVGCAMTWEALLFARSQLAAACAKAKVQLLDTPPEAIDDSDGLTASTSRAKALGFTGRTCIHPLQVSPINAVFTPSKVEVAWAQTVLDAFDRAEGGAAQLNGRLVELPVILRARRVLERYDLYAKMTVRNDKPASA